jgi:hypothetical protein
MPRFTVIPESRKTCIPCYGSAGPPALAKRANRPAICARTLSVIAGLSRTSCMSRLHGGSIQKEEHVEFFKALRAPLKCPLLIIWDGLKAHRSKHVGEYLDATKLKSAQQRPSIIAACWVQAGLW